MHTQIWIILHGIKFYMVCLCRIILGGLNDWNLQTED